MNISDVSFFILLVWCGWVTHRAIKKNAHKFNQSRKVRPVMGPKILACDPGDQEMEEWLAAKLEEEFVVNPVRSIPVRMANNPDLNTVLVADDGATVINVKLVHMEDQNQEPTNQPLKAYLGICTDGLGQYYEIYPQENRYETCTVH